MPGQYDPQYSPQLNGVAQLIADRPYKEAQMRAQQQQQLVQGLQQFGEGVNSLVQKRNSMAQALTLGKNLGMAPEQVQGLEPNQVLQSYVAQKGNVDMNLLMTMLHPNAATPNATTTVSGPGGQVPVASTGGPVLASLETPAPTQPSGQAGQPAPTSQPNAPSMPVPIVAPPARRRTVNKATMDAILKFAAMNKVDPVLTREQAIAAGGVRHGAHILPDAVPADSSRKENNEQDKLEQNALNRIATVRGDPSLARIESQRDAATVAFNTIQNAKNEHRDITQTEYYDTLGQLWKARTGASPTDQSIRDLDINTIQAAMNKKLTWVDGKPRGATTQQITDALQKFIDDSGKQADKLHEGYMKPRLVKPFGLSNERWKAIQESGRGLSFDEATKESRQVAPQNNATSTGSWTPDSEQRLQMLLEKQKNGSLRS